MQLPYTSLLRMHGWVGSLVKSACFDDSGKLLREKAFAKSISGKYNFCRENFADFSLMLQTDTTPPNFVEKTFTNSHKTSQNPQKFSPSNVSCCKATGAFSGNIGKLFSVLNLVTDNCLAIWCILFLHCMGKKLVLSNSCACVAITACCSSCVCVESSYICISCSL